VVARIRIIAYRYGVSWSTNESPSNNKHPNGLVEQRHAKKEENIRETDDANKE
jgi:hypothetical protein